MSDKTEFWTDDFCFFFIEPKSGKRFMIPLNTVAGVDQWMKAVRVRVGSSQIMSINSLGEYTISCDSIEEATEVFDIISSGYVDYRKRMYADSK